MVLQFQHFNSTKYVAQDSTAGIQTGYGLDDRGFGVQVAVRV
jgi:hypothetical protein